MLTIEEKLSWKKSKVCRIAEVQVFKSVEGAFEALVKRNLSYLGNVGAL